MKQFNLFVLATLMSCQYYSIAYSQDDVSTSVSLLKAKMYESQAKDNRYLDIRDSSLLNIGDKCPDFIVGDIIRYPKKSARISDFKGKLLILDFWDISCDPCYKAMPKNFELQSLFKDEVVIFPVTNGKKIEIEKFWNSSEYTKNVNLPTVIDSVMGRRFGVGITNGVPFEVWINAEGIIIGLTRGLEYMNAKEISALVRGEKTMMRNMRPINYDYNKPLIYGDNERSTVIAKSDIGIITKYKPLVRPKYGFKNNEKDLRFFSINYSIPDLFGFVLNELNQSSSTRTFLEFETKDSTLFYDRLFTNSKMGLTGSYHNEWTIDNTYCYEAIVQKDKYSKKEALELILRDLCKQLGFKGEYTSRSTDLFDIVDLAPKVHKPDSDKELKKDMIRFEKINEVIEHFNGLGTRPITLGKDRSKKSVSASELKVPLAALKDVSLLRQTLNKYGYDLKKVGIAPIKYFSVNASF